MCIRDSYKAFNGAADKGLVILSCELIDNNGKELQKCCNNYAKDWNLDAAFIDWMNNANTFCSTLVDLSLIHIFWPKARVSAS